MNLRTIQEIQPIKALPFPKLHLTSIRNTMVTCTGCFGSRMNIVRRKDNTQYITKCMSCKGSGLTWINDDLSSIRGGK